VIRHYCDWCGVEIRNGIEKITRKGYINGERPVPIHIVMHLNTPEPRKDVCHSCFRALVLDAIDTEIANLS
jgi:hypothetical protein